MKCLTFVFRIINIMIFDKIIETVAEEYSIDSHELFENNRRGPVMESRRMIIYILRRKYKWTYQKIGRKLNKDHATIIHHFKKMDFWIKQDPFLKDEVDELIAKIHFDPMLLSKRSFVDKIMTEIIVWDDQDVTKSNLEKLFKIEL